ncbi:hypothetical protein C7Y70_03930 [Pseudoalteromonas sp. KS88]|uniref:hypothetical protein n=1 Tax=Pseudoalteromonas sp. KS88 TaxID=2109918 RepID=UPI001080BF33|nr:hypothetical protein [Pseudoalteromonas sp. KS88]TGE84703.1 hypothetical protein C7Y70_03930 [Pseudoalteromonas sp. KS88]
MDNIAEIFISWFPLLLVLFIMWVMPIILIARSQKVGRQEKLAWVVACLFISWFCLLLFMLIAPLKPNDK